jgi:predicted SnoaL-like aldol condensation-catalyzing enzyme
LSSKAIADYYRRLYSPASSDAVQQFLTSGYVEHQAGTGYTKAGLLEYVGRRLARYPEHEIVIHRIVADASFVFLHVEERLARGEIVARGELFRTESGRIAEHWSAQVRDKTPRKNPHSTFDGPDVDRSKDTAAVHLARFDALDRRGFGRFELDAFFESRTPRYIQHSPTGRDTVEGLVDVLAKVRDLGIRMTMDVKRNLTEGDFIVTHRMYRTHPPFPEFKMINVFDLFRMTDDGRADEHWDVMEEITSESDIERMF